MKKILLIIFCIIITGCFDKTDEKGFYIEGRKKGIHKETNTKYNSNGFDKNGYNKLTNSTFDKEGWNYYGFNKERINKETGTLYNIEGWDIKSFNKEGIHKETGFNFVSSKYNLLMRTYETSNIMMERPFRTTIGGSNSEYFSRTDTFDGTTYIGRSFNDDLNTLAILAGTLSNNRYLLKNDKNNGRKMEYYKKVLTGENEISELINNKIYIDIITRHSPTKEVFSYLVLSFFSENKENRAEKIRISMDDEITNIDKYSFRSNLLELDFGILKKVPLYLNQIKIPLNDQLFNLFATMHKNKKIELSIVTDKDYRFNWTNIIEEKRGLPIGLGEYYRLKNISKITE